jgi:succinoglycan biosynthesis transport protein ExoP
MSSPETPARDTRTLREYLRVLRRHIKLLLVVTLLVPAIALAFSLRQQPLYSATARVYLSYKNVPAELESAGPNQGPTEDAERLTQTQAELASSALVARRTLQAAGLPGRSVESFLNHSSVSAAVNADFLLFTVRDRHPATAVVLANRYARNFTQYRLELDTASLVNAQHEVQASIGALSPSQRQSSFDTNLVNKLQQLKTLKALQTSNAFVVESAGTAHKVQPNPVRNTILGLILGLILGVAMVFLREALDTRVGSVDEVDELLGLPLLARISAPSRELRVRNQIAMLAEPGGVQAESFRMLRTGLDFASLSGDIRLIMVSSAVEEEGKSTTFANLAVAMARAGANVIVVDLDLRRPYIHNLFGVDSYQGVTDVVIGRVQLDEALREVDLSAAVGGPGGMYTTRAGKLEVLPSGTRPPDIGEFVGTAALGDLFNRLRGRADVVLIDAPPMLQVGDAMTLSAKVDGIVAVVDLNMARRPALKEYRRLLDVSPATKLGYVLTGTSIEAGYSYYGYGDDEPGPATDVDLQAEPTT